VIQVVYETPRSDPTSLEPPIATGTLVSLNESVDHLNIKSNVATDLDTSEPIHCGPCRILTMQIQENMKIMMDAMTARNRGGELNASTVHTIPEESLVTEYSRSMASSMTAIPGIESIIINRLDGLHDQGDVTQQIVRQVLEETQQIKDRLTLIQSKTEAILTQQLQLVEYPIPRLFIVLPEEPVKYDPGNWFRTKFRLHFICECGKHTEAHNSKAAHHLHLAKHEGYLIRKPIVFSQKYGPFLLLMLELIKFGTSIAGHVVPTLASLNVVELAGSVQQSVELIAAKIDISLECIDMQLTKVQASSPWDYTSTEPRAAMTQRDLANYLRNVEGLEGVELRQLGLFLKTSEEENLLGNLYRMTTSEGHVKWVCLDHYRASYQETQTQKLRDVVKLAQGEFDEQLGRIEITLKSSFAAAEFYDAIRQAKGVLELIIDLSWECMRSDLEALEETLKSSRVSILQLDLRQYRTSLGSRLFSTTTPYEVLLRIRELPNMRLIHVIIPLEFIKFSYVPPKTPKTSPNLCKFSFGLVAGSIGVKEFGRLAEALKTNSTLNTLDLGHGLIRDNGAQALAEALKTNSTLTALNLVGNSIGDNGVQALSEAFKINSTLTTLNIRYNSFRDNGAQALAEVLKTNSTLTTLNLWHNSIGDNGVQALAEALKTNSTLTTLSLGGKPIGENGARALSEALKVNSILTTLNFGGNSIGENGAQALSEALKTNSTLTTLNLWHNSIGDNGAQALSEALKTNSTLSTLDLRNISIGDNGAQALADALKTNMTLTTLNLESNKIGFEGILVLTLACNINSTLTTLDLRRNSIKDNTVLVLSDAFKTDSTLTTLDLGHSSLRDNGGQALAEALKTNSTLTALNLVGNSIGDNGVQALSEALKTNSTLTTLDLGSNLIRVNGAKALAEAVKTNSTLTNLNLGHSSIRDNGAQALAEALKTNLTLNTLDLGANWIGNNGAQALSEALQTNATLSTLVLVKNLIGDNGAQALAEALKTNSSLTTLDLENNLIRDKGALSLAETLKTNSSLTILDLRSNKIGANGGQALSEALKATSGGIIPNVRY
ncbi:hypothetical protein BG006_010611, partial [Podila minutissima]